MRRRCEWGRLHIIERLHAIWECERQCKLEMMKNSIKPPQMQSDIDLFAKTISKDQIQCNTRYEHVALIEQNYSGQIAIGSAFDECRFERTSFRNAQLEELRLTDVSLEECDLANAIWLKTTLTRVEMVDCRLLGFRANEADVQHMVFRNCNISLAQFRFAKFKSVRFEKCNLQNADFYQSDLRGVIFDNCDLKEAQMSSAKLTNTDFRGSEINGLQVAQSDLKGLIVEPFQAAYLAGLMGLQVVWNDAKE